MAKARKRVTSLSKVAQLPQYVRSRLGAGLVRREDGPLECDCAGDAQVVDWVAERAEPPGYHVCAVYDCENPLSTWADLSPERSAITRTAFLIQAARLKFPLFDPQVARKREGPLIGALHRDSDRSTGACGADAAVGGEERLQRLPHAAVEWA